MRKNRRRHERHTVSQINPIKLTSVTGAIFFVVPVDESEFGFGCIYSGKNPPQVDQVYMVGEKGAIRTMEVRWIDSIGNNRFRLGLMDNDS